MNIIRTYTIHLLLIFHIVGVLIFAYLQYAPNISYLMIALSSLLVLINEPKTLKSIILFSLIFVLGFIIELIGVQTALLFGEYHYQPAMGPQLMSTPIFIGVTWYTVVVGATNVTRKTNYSIWIKAILAGVLAVGLDFLIERVAISYGFWSWDNGYVPIYNYLCWFIFSVIFSFIYLYFQKSINRPSFYLYIVWIIFFTLLILIKT